MNFSFTQSSIPEVLIIEPKMHSDERGFFAEMYKYSAFKQFGIDEHFVQSNHSLSKRGVLRGLHFQKPPKAQAKLVRCIRGEIFDVAVDVRQGSPTYSQWVGETLSFENKKILYIPTGFAHGFCVLSEEAEILYLSSEEYAPETESGIIWNDPQLSISWPTDQLVISTKDQNLKPLTEIDSGFKYP